MSSRYDIMSDVLNGMMLFASIGAISTALVIGYGGYKVVEFFINNDIVVEVVNENDSSRKSAHNQIKQKTQ